MAYNICKVKNIDTVSHTYSGQEITAGSTYTIQDGERITWANNSTLLAHITSDKAQIWDSVAAISDYNDQIEWLKDSTPKQVQPITPVNEHTLTPLGLGKKEISNSSYCATITLANKSTNTFDYSSCSLTPAIGDVLTEDSYTNRAVITAVDTGAGTLTVDDASNLSNGILRYLSKPLKLQYKLPSSIPETYIQYHMLWGVRVSTNGTHGENDIGQCKIIDEDNVLGAGAGYVVSYYDETWIQFFDKEPLFRIPDNSPGPIPPGLYLTLIYYTTQLTGTTKIWWDYLTTYRDV